MVQLACCSILTSSEWMGWSSVHAFLSLTNVHLSQVHGTSVDILPRCTGCRGRMDEGVRITIPYERFHEEVYTFLQVPFLLHNVCGAVVETIYCNPLHVCWMVRTKVQVHLTVRVCQFTVYSNVNFTICILWYQHMDGLLHMHHLRSIRPTTKFNKDLEDGESLPYPL